MPIRGPSTTLRTTSSLSPQLGPRVQDGDEGQDVHLRVKHFPKEDEQVRVPRVDKGREETYRGDRRWESRFDGDAKSQAASEDDQHRSVQADIFCDRK